MTSPVNSYSQSQALPDSVVPPGMAQSTPSGASSSTTSSGSPSASAPSSGEAVTLTAQAQSSADLLEAARAAAGVDLQAVQSLKTQLTSGAYQVPSENLAASIVAALTEIR
jgi:flagellar biosynthesis anti-sigma factor FlgM